MTQSVADPPSPAGAQPSASRLVVRHRVWSLRHDTRQVRVHDPTALADEGRLRFALSQAITDDPVARTWARVLARHVVTHGLPQPGPEPSGALDIDAWLAPAWQSWRQDVAPSAAALRSPRAPALDLPVLGAAALCAVEITPLEGGTFRLWALFQGDVCLFQVRGRNTLLRLPLRQASQFADSSACFFSEPIPTRHPPRRIRHDGRMGDVLALASAPLARWLYGRLEVGIDPWPLLLNLPDDDAFGDLVLRERAEGRLPAGDITLLLLRTDPLPGSPLPRSPIPLDPHDLVEPRHSFYAAPPPPDPEPALPHPPPAVALAEFSEEEEPMGVGERGVEVEVEAEEAELELDEEDVEDNDEAGVYVRLAAVSLVPGTFRVQVQEADDDTDEEGQFPGVDDLDDVVLPGAIQGDRGAGQPGTLDSGTWDEEEGEDAEAVDSHKPFSAPELDDTLTDAFLLNAIEPPSPRIPPPFRASLPPRMPSPTPGSASPRALHEPMPAAERRRRVEPAGWKDALSLILVVILSSIITLLLLAVGQRLLQPPPPPEPTAAAASPDPTPTPAPSPVPVPTPAPEPAAAPTEPAAVPDAAVLTTLRAVEGRLAGVEGRLEQLDGLLQRLEVQEQQAQRLQQQAETIRALEARLAAPPPPAPAAPAAPEVRAPSGRGSSEPAPTDNDGQRLSGVQASSGARQGWVRCIAPVCVREGGQARLSAAAPAWATPYSATRTAFVGAGQYAVVGSQEVGGETWVEIRLR